MYGNIVPMTAAYAGEMAFWRYEGECSFYNRNGRTDYPEGEAFACLDREGKLIGHFHFGADARIPTVEANVYEGDHLDLGLGLRPELCGKGLGEEFVRLGMEFGRKQFSARSFRLSVACFNKRAVKVYERCGFRVERDVTNSYFKNKFYVMTTGNSPEFHGGTERRDLI